MDRRTKTCCRLFLLLALAGCRPRGGRPDATSTERDRAVAAAQELYRRKKADGVDMSRGPCLGEVLDGWVVDVAHLPRQPIDDAPENQCRAYRNGHVHHFVELDPDGNLIRAL